MASVLTIFFLGMVDTKVVNRCAGSQYDNRGDFSSVPYSQLLGGRNDCLLF